MSVLAGPFAIAAAVLALGGALKMLEPADTAHALAALRLPSARPLVRFAGTVEAFIAIGALVYGSRALAIAVAVSYFAFAVFVMVALRSGLPITSCGCFGKVDTPPSWVHIAIDVAAAGVAAGAAFTETSEIALPDVLAEQPLAGVPFVVLAAVGVMLVFLAFTALPKTIAAARALRAARS
jgi:methylamine utilization protein MauE